MGSKSCRTGSRCLGEVEGPQQGSVVGWQEPDPDDMPFVGGHMNAQEALAYSSDNTSAVRSRP